MYRSGNHGRSFTKDCVRSILLFAFKEEPKKKSGLREEWIGQLKELNDKDTKGRIDQALLDFETTNSGTSVDLALTTVEDDRTPDEVGVTSDEDRAQIDLNCRSPKKRRHCATHSICNSVETSDDDGDDDDSGDWEDSPSKSVDGQRTVNAPAVDQGIDNPIRKRSLAQTLSSTAGQTEEEFIHPEDDIIGCGAAFDSMSKCVSAICSSCLSRESGNQTKRPRDCHCRGRSAKRSAKFLSDKIVADWQIGKKDMQDEKFEDLLFALPVSCSVCHSYLSKEVKACVDEEVENDRIKKQEKNPAWKARDWSTLRSVVQDSWDR